MFNPCMPPLSPTTEPTHSRACIPWLEKPVCHNYGAHRLQRLHITTTEPMCYPCCLLSPHTSRTPCSVTRTQHSLPRKRNRHRMREKHRLRTKCLNRVKDRKAGRQTGRHQEARQNIQQKIESTEGKTEEARLLPKES